MRLTKNRCWIVNGLLFGLLIDVAGGKMAFAEVLELRL